MLVANFGQTYFGADDGAAGPQTRDASEPAFATDAEVAAFVRRFVEWMNYAEQQLNKWFGLLMYQVSLGVAKCEDVQAFNRESMRLFALESQLLTKLRKSPELAKHLPGSIPIPPLFAHSATVNRYLGGPEYIDAKLICDADRIADPATLKIYGSGTRACATNADDRSVALGGLIPVCIPGGLAACAIQGGFTLAIIIAGGYAAFRAVRAAFTRTDEIEAQAVMEQTIGTIEIKSLEDTNDCIANALAKVPADKVNDPSTLALLKNCQDAQAGSKRGRPTLPLSNLAWVAVGAIGVVGGIAAITYFKNRVSSSALPRATARSRRGDD